jgi:hypothetical protein
LPGLLTEHRRFDASKEQAKVPDLSSGQDDVVAARKAREAIGGKAPFNSGVGCPIIGNAAGNRNVQTVPTFVPGILRDRRLGYAIPGRIVG